MTVSKEWLDTEIAERSKEPHRTMYSRTLLDALKELASLRAADEGAVTVEAYLMPCCSGAKCEMPTNHLVDESFLSDEEKAAGQHVTVTIRKAKP